MAQKFNLTRDRSKANSKYKFSFIGNSQKAIAPVLKKYKSGEFRIIGTCSYFIRPNLFITAAHIFEGDDINDDDGFYIILDGTMEPLQITQIHKYESADLAIFLLDSNVQEYLEDVNPVAVMNLLPEQSEIVALFGFSHSDVDPSNTEEIANGDIYQKMHLRSKWELGGVLEVHTNGCRLVKGQCFESSILAEGRDSGAPMFNSNGFLVGLLSTSLEFESGLPNSVCSSILQLADISINGMPIKKLWNSTHRAAYCKIES